VLQKLDDQIGESARVDPEVDRALELQKISTLLIQENLCIGMSSSLGMI
jgi:hypothetical protein